MAKKGFSQGSAMRRLSFISIVLVLIMQSALVYGQVDPCYFKGEEWQDETNAKVTTLYYTLGDADWPSADPFRMVVIGDSIAWGTGLYKWEKYHYLVADWLQKTLKRPVEVTVLAHTGATIVKPTKIDNSKHKFIDPEFGSWDPTVMEQADHIPDPKDVDLILVSGGINDVDIGILLDPSDKSNEISTRCQNVRLSMNYLLMDLLKKSDKSIIIVTDYYIIASKDTPSSSIQMFANFIKKNDQNWLHKIFGPSKIINSLDIISSNCAKFYSQSKDNLGNSTGAVYYANEYSLNHFGKDRVYFADVNFPVERAYGTSKSLLWELVDANGGGKTNDHKYDYRISLWKRGHHNWDDKVQAMGHPNVEGDKEYANAIETVITSKGLFGIDKQQSSKQAGAQLLEPISVLLLTQVQPLLGYWNNYWADHWNQPTNLQKAEAQPWKQKGFDYLTHNRNEEAIQAYNKAIEINPRDKDTWNKIGTAYYGLHRYRDAAQAFEKGDEIDSRYVDFDEAAVLCNLNRYEEAIQVMDKLINSDPDYALYWNEKSSYLDDLGKYDEAIQAANKAIELEMKNNWPWINKGAALKGQGKYDEAIECYDKAIEIYPEDKDAWINKGEVLSAQGKHEDAIKALDKAIKIKPTYEPEIAWMAKGNALYNYGKYKEAIECYDKAIESEPQYIDPWINKGNALGLLGHNTDAKAAYVKALEVCDKDIGIYPQYTRLFIAKGNILRLLGRTTEAEAAYAIARDLRYNG